MTTPLLTTKLYMPPARPDLVLRPHLTSRLSAALSCPLTLVSAPAGFGKTTLLGEWRTTQAGREYPLGWLSLDPDDSDPHRFWSYVTAALCTLPVFPANTAWGADALELLRTAPGLEPRHYLPPLLNELAAASAPFALVLDDYHAIESPLIRTSVQFLIDHLPPQMHLVLLTRQDPPWPLARLRSLGRLAEFRAADLRFSDAEAAALLDRTLAGGLPAADVVALQQRTEGWAAALHMAAISLAGQADRHAFVAAFAGEHRYVADYLSEEVLSRQPEPVQAFLMATAILERMTAPLCAAVTGQDDAGVLLEQIERANLFLVPLDEERRWFRYHHLFADLLRARLQRLRPDLVPVLYQRASAWHEAASDALSAANYALAGGDHQNAARLVEQNVHDWWGLAQNDFLRLLTRLPDAVIRSRPALAVYRAWVCILTGRLDGAGALLAAADSGPEACPRALESFVALMGTYVMELTGQTYALSELVRQAPAQIPETKVAMRNSADVILAFLLYMNGDLDAAAAILTDAACRDAAANLTEAGPIAISRLARIRMLQGRLPEAEALCRRHLEQMAGRHFVNGSLHAALADALREQNDLEGAEAQAREAIAQNEAWQIPEAVASAYLLEARILLARGDVDGAAHALAQADGCGRGRTLGTDLVQQQQAIQVRLWLAGGNRSAAQQWAERRLPSPATPLPFRQEAEQVAVARILLAEGRPAEAQEVLQRLAAGAAAGGRNGRLIEVLVLQALALQALDPDRALAVLEQALTLAEPSGYVRTFLDEGSPLAALLRNLSDRRGPAQAFARRLLAAFPAEPEPAPSPAAALPEPLTGRELEVLRLLAAGLSNQELAARLTVTYGTVKTHVHHIYEKLGADSRARAIARARELHLI